MPSATISPERLGFMVDSSGEPVAWTKRVAGFDCWFRLLRSLPELLPAEALQRDVLGVTDHDLNPAIGLITVHDTGGDVIGAFRAAGGVEEPIAVCVGYGGYFARRPRMLSDLLVVRADMRSAGLGAEMKKLQAAIALARGFEEIVWTVDPLRAANARLNVEKLGATACRYDVDRYGSGFGAGLYGGLPTDRLHMTWEIMSPAVHDRLLGKVPPLTTADIEDVLHFDPDRIGSERVLVHLPSDIEALLARDPNAALRWRLTLRETLQLAFTMGYVITGFVPATVPELELSSYVLTKCG
jgi:predicted GNAT superfamily acetyltransferase